MILYTRAIVTALTCCATLSLLQADIAITNKTNDTIEVTPTFGEKACTTKPCPGQITVEGYGSGTIPTTMRSRKISRITIILNENSRTGGERRRVIKTLMFSSDDTIHNSGTHHLEYNGEIQVID